jgi:hypothetical protein
VNRSKEMHSDVYEDTILVEVEEDRSEHRGTVLIKYLAIFCLCPSKQFLLKSFQIQLAGGIFFPKQKEQRHM